MIQNRIGIKKNIAQHKGELRDKGSEITVMTGTHHNNTFLKSVDL